MLNNNATKVCPCHSGRLYNDCCGNFINTSEYPDTAEQLMRSRYSAYTLKDEAYLLNSWHKSTRPVSLDIQNDTTQWKKLKIISSSDNNVTFLAFFNDNIKVKDRLLFLYEESNFIKDRHWFYVEGHNLKTGELSKNMLCPCQSGKKFKRCCAKEI